MKTSKYLYTVVCRYYTTNGIIELDLYEVFKRLHMKPYYEEANGYKYWRHMEVVRHNVMTGQSVEYVIKKVLRNIDITEETRQFYSYYSPYSIMYDCRLDLKDVASMNYEKVFIRNRLSDEEFKKIYGGEKK